MGFEGDGGQQGYAITLFWLPLSFIIVGSGSLKANISVIVGQLYPLTDVRRDAAYTIFYMGIHVGAALRAFACGLVWQTYGSAFRFGLAGFALLLGLLVYTGRPSCR